jgi:TrmH family RNA methyltransferase
LSPYSPRRHKHILAGTRIILVRPSYPENIGACARAMQVTGFHELVLVNPHALADPDHPNAVKMAVGSLDILGRVLIMGSLDEAVKGFDVIAGTSGRAGVPNAVSVRTAAPALAELGRERKKIALVFGGERDGLRKNELVRCSMRIRIPMAGREPSLNLAQAVMIVLYEMLMAVL